LDSGEIGGNIHFLYNGENIPVQEGIDEYERFGDSPRQLPMNKREYERKKFLKTAYGSVLAFYCRNVLFVLKLKK
jgi:hypothetical protein